MKLAARQGAKSEANSEASSRREEAEARVEVEGQRRAAAEGSIYSRENKGTGAGASNSRRFGLGTSRERSETNDAGRRK